MESVSGGTRRGWELRGAMAGSPCARRWSGDVHSRTALGSRWGWGKSRPVLPCREEKRQRVEGFEQAEKGWRSYEPRKEWGVVVEVQLSFCRYLRKFIFDFTEDYS
jgi:hypothetical protein